MKYTEWKAIGMTGCGRPVGLAEPGQDLKNRCEKSLEISITEDDFRMWERRYAFPARRGGLQRDVFVHTFMLEDLREGKSARVEEYWTIEHQARTADKEESDATAF